MAMSELFDKQRLQIPAQTVSGREVKAAPAAGLLGKQLSPVLCPETSEYPRAPSTKKQQWKEFFPLKRTYFSSFELYSEQRANASEDSSLEPHKWVSAPKENTHSYPQQPIHHLKSTFLWPEFFSLCDATQWCAQRIAETPRVPFQKLLLEKLGLDAPRGTDERITYGRVNLQTVQPPFRHNKAYCGHKNLFILLTCHEKAVSWSHVWAKQQQHICRYLAQ